MNNIEKIYTDKVSLFADKYLEYIASILKSINTEHIEKLVFLLKQARENDANIFVIGNGGSAATATHFANDISIGAYSEGQPFNVTSLTDNQAMITAIANDFGYEHVFEKQLRAFAKKGDLCIAISASGNSPNLISAFEYARKSGIASFAITAFDGGKLKEIADNYIHIKTELKEYGPAEDVHMILSGLIGSYLSQLVKKEIN